MYNKSVVNGDINHFFYYRILSILIHTHTREERRIFFLKKLIVVYVGNKGEIIPKFSLEITQFDFTKRGGRDQVRTKLLF